MALAFMLFVAGVLSARRACAHDPHFACSPRPASSPIVVTDPVKSWAFYGNLRAPQSDVYELHAARPLRVAASLLVDARDAGNPARPVAVFRGADGKPFATLDLRKPVGFYEPFSRVQYDSTPDRTIALPAGTSTVDVTMRGGPLPQRYTFAIGNDERFDTLEFPYILGAIIRIHNRYY